MSNFPTKEEVLSDLQSIADSQSATVTRNYYRANGSYSEADWQRYFPTFDAFMKAAGLVKDSR